MVANHITLPPTPSPPAAAITSGEYRRRRRHLLAALGETGVALLTTAPERVRNGHTHYPYRQSSDFSYLTGFLCRLYRTAFGCRR